MILKEIIAAICQVRVKKNSDLHESCDEHEEQEENHYSSFSEEDKCASGMYCLLNTALNFVIIEREKLHDGIK